MKARLILLWFTLTMPFLTMAQTIRPLAAENFPDGVVGSATYYNLESLNGYSDEADLYTEAGFRSLMVQDVIWSKLKFRVEVYQMDAPESAFGMLSLSGTRCMVRDTLVPNDCFSLYQYQCAIGNLYVTVGNETGSNLARSMYLPIARVVMELNPGAPLSLPDPFKNATLKKCRNNLVYIEGFTGLQNSLFPWQDIFLGVRFGMFATYFTSPDSEIYFARIWFESPADRARFLTLAGLMLNGAPVPNTNTNDGIYREFSVVDDLTIYFLQSQLPYPISAVTGK